MMMEQQQQKQQQISKISREDRMCDMLSSFLIGKRSKKFSEGRGELSNLLFTFFYVVSGNLQLSLNGKDFLCVYQQQMNAETGF